MPINPSIYHVHSLTRYKRELINLDMLCPYSSLDNTAHVMSGLPIHVALVLPADFHFILYYLLYKPT